uniref:DH domain-containing protein n=1 Tax=Anopheles atroparvus TaxID=41427 RepID=A0AAG5DSU3_ANOAO
MLKMMNRSKKANQGGQRGVRGTPLDGKDAKVGRQGVGLSASAVGPAKPSLAPMAPQSQVGVPAQPTAAGGGSGGGGGAVGGRTKKVKQQSGSKGGGGKVTGGSRSGRSTVAVGKETSATKASGDSAHGGGQLGFEVPGGGGGVGGLGSLGPLGGPKMERSNSFYLARKLSSLYSKLSGSRENVSSANAVSVSTGGEETVDRAQPFQFVRSRSMSSIQLKRAYRRSQNESTLQNLQEDAILERSESTEETAGPTPREEAKEPVVSAAIPVTPDTPPPMPRFERSNSILASIRRKISFRSDRRSSTVSNWSTSLQNLRQEDFMISYDDLSFIDYDQFNSYETNLLKRQSVGLVSDSFDPKRLPPPVNVSDVRPEELAQTIDNAPALEATNNGVIRRRRKHDNLLRTTLIRKSMDVESNLDRDKNVYRNSLDAEKLLCISKVNRKSFRWSADVERDVVALDLESVDFAAGKPLAELVASRQTTPPPYDVCDSGMIDGSESVKLGTIDDNTEEPTMTASSVGYVSRSESMKRSRSYGGEGGVAFEEGFGHPAKQMQMKSLSLTHLDEIERQAPTPTIITNDPHTVKVSSSEYFSVCFESDNNDPGMPIPATKGVRLAECLRASLSRRSLSFSQIYVIDNGFNNPHETGMRYSEPLDANMDISALAGRTLIVSERDGAPSRPRTGAHVTLQKAASVGNQPSMMSSTSKLFTSTSTDETFDQSPKASSSASGKQSKQKWTIPFGSKGPQKSKLCELLDSYNKEIPKSTSSSSNFNNPEYVDALVGLRNLPQCWTEIVNSAGMCESETKIQSAIWELVTTEVYYILALQTVTDLFLACLEDIQSQNILTDVDQNKLFSNIRDIWEANLRFWTLYLHPMVRYSQRTKEPMSIYYFQLGFVEFATIFTPYTKYCAEQSTCQFYCKEMYHNNALFMTYCAWCESQKMCNRLRLADILVRPMQRLTKYGLLLAAIKKHITDEAEGEAIDAMIHSVEEFVAGVNSHLTTRQENERLKGINARIESYDVVDSNNETLDRMVKQHSVMFDLCQPLRGIDHGRKVFVEGDLKYKDSTGKMDVHCFLFTDFLLVCKKIKSEKLKIIRQPYMTDRLMVQLKDQTLYCCYMNELNMVVAAFSLQSPKAQHWYDSITKVKHIYNRMKLGAFSDVRQYGNIINISNSCNNSTSNSNMNINNDNLSIKKSPLNSSIGSRVSSLNNSHSGSVDLNESKQVSIDFEKTNSLSSDEGAGAAIGNAIAGAGMIHAKYGVPLIPGTSRKPKNTVSTMQTKSSNSLTVQPYSLGQSMPNLNLNSIQNSNTLSVPGTSSALSHSGMVLLSPSQRGISYPPPSPTRSISYC